MKKTDIQTRQAKYDLENQVVMANDMIKGISKLSLNESKLLRTIIMQIKPQDEDLEVFTVKIKEFAELVGIDKNHMYSEADKMTDSLMSEVIRIGDGNPRHKWKKLHWVDLCEYDSGTITIKVSNELKPYILGLQKWYTQYRLEDIIYFKSVYSIRIYELIAMCLKDQKPYADKKTEVYISMEDLRKSTNTEHKYERLSQFKEKVINIALRDINQTSSYHVSVRDYKEGRKVVGFYFNVESRIGFEYKEVQEPEEVIVRQMELDDFMGECDG